MNTKLYSWKIWRRGEGIIGTQLLFLATVASSAEEARARILAGRADWGLDLSENPKETPLDGFVAECEIVE